MTPDFIVTFAREAIYVAIKLSAAPLLVALVVGLVVSIFQAVTQIQEMTLAIIPKMISVILVLLLLLPWLLNVSITFIEQVYGLIPQLVS